MTTRVAGHLRWHEWLLTVSGALLFVVMFLDWFTASGDVGVFSNGPEGWKFTTRSGQRSAWQAFTSIDVVLALTIVGALTLAVLVARGAIEAGGVWARALARAVTVLAAISAVLVAVRLVFAPPPVAVAQALGVHPTAWAWIGLLACCLLVAGGAVTLRRAREEDVLPEAGRGYGGRGVAS
ncbi:MAG TPA: hypothetical protein VKB03_11755 [Conexibacter sp.]|nr:hypothetical protein [Conexibacter sp.]